MLKVEFPAYVPEWDAKGRPHRYYGRPAFVHSLGYFRWILNMLRAAGCHVEEYDPRDEDSCFIRFLPEVFFTDIIGNRYRTIFDFHEHGDPEYDLSFGDYTCVFKLWWHEESFKEMRTKYHPLPIYSIGPPSFWDWDLLQRTKVLHGGRPFRSLVWKQQRSRCRPLELMNKIKHSLQLANIHVNTDRVEHEMFIQLLGQASCCLCMPGARPDILDKGQMQAFALGACTVSPRINAELAYGRVVRSGVHYVECRGDYKDVAEKVLWCLDNPTEAHNIARSARELFFETSTPEKLIQWINILLLASSLPSDLDTDSTSGRTSTA